MKRTNHQTTDTLAPTAAESLKDLQAIQDLDALIEQRNVLESRALEIPDQIRLARLELDAVGTQILDSELALLQVPEKSLPEAITKRDALERQQVECTLRIRRLETQLTAIEARAPELDAKIELAIGMVRIEANIASETIQTELAQEIRAKSADLQVLFAKVRTLQRLVPAPRTNDFLLDAYVPDLESCMRINTGTSSYNSAPNLLNGNNPETQRAEAEIAAVLKPISDALVTSRKHRPYVPLAKRPAPYVIKGSNEGPAYGSGGSIGMPAPPPAVVEPKPVFAGYRTDEPYSIKSDQSGIRTRQAGTELNLAHAALGNHADASTLERQA